jgi:hypothetical protein
LQSCLYLQGGRAAGFVKHFYLPTEIYGNSGQVSAAVALYTYIREVVGWNIGLHAGYTDLFRNFHQSLQTTALILYNAMTVSFRIFFKSSFICYSSIPHYIVQMQKVSINVPVKDKVVPVLN